jgi:hypothetical protein
LQKAKKINAISCLQLPLFLTIIDRGNSNEQLHNAYLRKGHTTGKKFANACIPQFQKIGAVPNRALTVGTPKILKALFTSGKFLEFKM